MSSQQPNVHMDTVAVNAQVYEDNFNVLSQIINNYGTSNYSDGLNESETNSSVNSDNSREREKKPLTNAFKYYLLVLFSTIYLTYGIQNNLLGPAMIDLTKVLNTSTGNLSVALSLKNLIFCFSTILVSFSFKFFGNRQFQYALAVFSIAIVTALTPHMTSFRQYLVGVTVNGLSSAFIDSVTNLIVLELWSLNSKIYMQIAHGCFTIGAIFGPLLVGPFLSKNNEDNSTIPTNGTTTILPNNTDWTTTTETPFNTTLLLQNETMAAFTSLEDDPENLDTRIVVPYSIVSLLMITGVIVMVISQIVHPYIPEKRKLFAKQKSKRIVEQLEEQIEGSQTFGSSPEISQSSVNNSVEKPKLETVCEQINLPKTYYLIFLGLTGLLLSIYSCVDGLTGSFLPIYLAKSELKIDKTQAAFFSSVVYMSMASSRLLTIIFAFKTTCKILLFFNISTLQLGYITLTFFAVHSPFLTWISLIAIGIGQGATYPLVLSYIENRIVITNTVQLYLLFVSTLFMAFIPIIVGYFIETWPMIFSYINVTFSVIALILMLLIHATDVWKRKLIKKINEDQQILVHEDQQD